MANTPTSQHNQFLRYSGMGFEIVASLLLGWWLGAKLDAYFETKNQIGTLLLTLIMLFASLFRTIRSLMKDTK